MSTSSRDINELADNLGKIQISDLIENRESEFGSNSAPTHDGSELESPFGLHMIATVYREALQSESLSTLEKDLDDLFNSDSDLSLRRNINVPLLLRLREDAQRPAEDYFDYSSRLEN
jgi:hypothetical protein